MLILGEQKISGLYVGGEKIVKAYVGEDLVFSAEKASRLPEGYTELEYVQVGPNNSTLANFSLATARSDQVLTIDFTIEKFPTASDGGIYSYVPCILFSSATVNSTAQTRDVLWLSKDGLYANAASASAVSSGKIQLISDITVPQRVKVVWDGANQCASVNGLTPIAFKSYGVGTSWLLGSTTAGTSTSHCWRVASVKIHSIKISSAGSASSSYNKDYVPAKDASGRIGLYNLLAGKFIYHTSLIAGPAV